MFDNPDNYMQIDNIFIPMDKNNIRRTRNIRLIPAAEHRRGGKTSYAEWAHVIGIFQTLMLLHSNKSEDNIILDVGCGTGLLGIASEPLLGQNGRYTGIDVMKKDIDFCKNHYTEPYFEFIHFDINNIAYAPTQEKTKIQWPIQESSFDLVTALSVWTHLNEEDALFYFKEISRALKPGGKAIITFFVLDTAYQNSLTMRLNKPGRYHMTSQLKWIFDRPAYNSNAWFCPNWVRVPENAVGITEDGINRLASIAGLNKVKHYQGNWKETPGIFFQDVLIFENS